MKQHSFQILRQGIALEAGVSLAEGAVSVGVHMDNASADDLALLASMYEALCKEICAYLKTEVQ